MLTKLETGLTGDMKKCWRSIWRRHEKSGAILWNSGAL